MAMEAGVLPSGTPRARRTSCARWAPDTPWAGSSAAGWPPRAGARRAPDSRHQGPGDPRVRPALAQGHRGDLRDWGRWAATTPPATPWRRRRRSTRRGAHGQVATRLRLQIRGAILDSLGVCLFIRPAFVKDPALTARLLNARYGWKWTYADVRAMALECLRAEQEFNTRAGVTDAMCDVPEFMRREPLPPHNTVFDVDREEMRHIWELEAAGGRDFERQGVHHHRGRPRPRRGDRPPLPPGRRPPGALGPQRRGRREARRQLSTPSTDARVIGQQVDVTSEAGVQAAVDAAVAQLRARSTCW
ncbi:MAG: hypothetical protein MZV63_60185 [Marinilabiliales bacterium]|nr:hypothetical protein [Marinilabiliales bacterium]